MKKLLLILLLFFPVHGAWAKLTYLECKEQYTDDKTYWVFNEVREGNNIYDVREQGIWQLNSKDLDIGEHARHFPKSLGIYFKNYESFYHWHVNEKVFQFTKKLYEKHNYELYESTITYWKEDARLVRERKYIDHDKFFKKHQKEQTRYNCKITETKGTIQDISETYDKHDIREFKKNYEKERIIVENRKPEKPKSLPEQLKEKSDEKISDDLYCADYAKDAKSDTGAKQLYKACMKTRGH